MVRGRASEGADRRLRADQANHDLLCRNPERLRVEAHRAAIGARDGRVNVSDLGRGEWAYRTEISDIGACAMMAMSRVVAEKEAAGAVPFIAKIDIEGAERDLLRSPPPGSTAFCC